MISKKHPIEILEKALEYENNLLESCRKCIKSYRNQAAENESHAMVCIARISGLEDALHKLKGLDNLEKKNKIADPGGSVHPDYVISQGIKIGPLYDELQNEAKRRGE